MKTPRFAWWWGRSTWCEKIAQLSQVPVGQLSQHEHGFLSPIGNRALKDAFKKAADAELGDSPVCMPKKIVKEGLSEYFIYTIEGTESIPDGWSKRLRSIEGSEIPLKIQYRYRPREYGEHLVRMYLFANDKLSKLGTTPLPDGTLRVFRDNGRHGLSYLASQPIKYIPIGDKIELNLGPDPQVIFELIKLRAFRDDIWMQINGVNVFHRIGQPGGQIEVNSSVAGWDDHEIYTQRVRNYSGKPIEVEVRRAFTGHVAFRSGLGPVLHDYQTVQFVAPVDAGKKADLLFELVRHQGRNSKQNNVVLEEAAVAP